MLWCTGWDGKNPSKNGSTEYEKKNYKEKHGSIMEIVLRLTALHMNCDATEQHCKIKHLLSIREHMSDAI